jgi:antitoxin ParD1/3/4
MSTEQTVSLTDHFNAFVEKTASEGRFASRSAVVEAGLRLLEREEAKLSLLRKAIEDGDASGLALPFDFQDVYDEIEADDEAAE